MNELQVFQNEEFGAVRTLTINSEPYFVGKDVATILGYAKPLNALATHVDEDESLKQGLTDSMGRIQETILINESGLYSLILSSKLPNAKKFKRWVTSEVLPSIRKHGVYAVDEVLANPDILIEALTQLKLERESKKQLEEQLDYSKEWYSIKRVAALNHVSHKRFNWRKLKQDSLEISKPPKKIFDANYGEVNIYHKDAWEKAYPQYEL